MRPGVVGLTALVALSVPAAAEPTGVVRISGGEVRGTVVDGGARFLGIPYAAPPVGDLRWRPPQDASRWSGTLQATEFRGTCAQPQRGVFAAPSNTEDCLYLNVY